MTTLWQKAIRDVWRERTRAVLVVLAIAIGLGSFQAVLSTYAVLRRELNRGYLETNPASAVLLADEIHDELLDVVAARDDVEEADARRVLRGRIQVGPSSWRRLTIFVIRDFRQLRISTISSDTGAWPPAEGEMLIERDAFQVARARVGDTVTVEIAKDHPVTLRVAGGVHDVGQAQARMENTVYAYISPATLTRLGEQPFLDRLLILVSGDRFDKARVTRVANEVKALLESHAHVVKRVDVPSPGEHPHAMIMGLLLMFMAAFGLFALGLSGVIVVNLLLAMIAAERRQIGVMKAIGGTRRQIAQIYFTEAAFFGAAAFVIALPAGIAGGRWLIAYFAVLLNFDIASLWVPVWVYLLVASVALLVPLAAAAYPVVSGTAMTVREALAAAGADLVVRRAHKTTRVIGALGTPLLLGVRNSFRRPARTALTLTTLTIAGAAFVSALSLRASMIAALDKTLAGTSAGNRYAIDQHMLMIYVFLIVVSVVLAAVGGLGLTTATSLNVLERRRELGVLRAIGAVPRVIAAIVVLEAVFIAVLGWVLALTIAWLISTAVGRLVDNVLLRGGFEIFLPASAVLGWLAISTALSVAASIVPALNASRRSIREAVSYE